MKILVAAICIGLQIISAQTTPPAPVAVTGEPPEGKTLKMTSQRMTSHRIVG